MSLFLVTGILFFLEIAGSPAVTRVFVQTGADLILNVTEAEIPPKYQLWTWQFNGATMVAFSPDSQPTVVSHTERIEVLKKKYCVKLRNLQKSDMGIYTAKVLLPKEQKLTEYDVTVQDPVSPVYLTTDSVSSTFSTCDLTVTCSTDNSNISSTIRCDKQNCHQEKGPGSVVTKSGASLHMYLSHSSIICNHSNQASWSKDTGIIEHFCRPCTNLSVVCLVKKVLFSFGLIIMVSAVFGVHLMEKVGKQK
ncbi:uncharacterized protein LOC124870538 [Girardinichthys multiradiatus]|uniref:uncharacterized protein LOC124870538 n=1 Tax=Girardinichthys multiradiatus TaxID=208333 RepID=UPI001FADBAAA|nr:uncharacterized protein LOC124870538 [Girardinichthys multiradiatus]